MITNTENSLGLIPKICLVAAILVLVVSAIIYPIVGHDNIVHLQWLSQFPKLFADGILYPRWLPDSYLGFGAPVFYFYPPMVYWVGGILFSFGVHSEYALFQGITILFTLLSGITAYWYLKTLTKNKMNALIGAAVYCVFPYRFADMYLRNALGEHAAFVFLPIILLPLLSIQQERGHERLKIIFITAIGWAGMLITNIPTTVILIYLVIVYIVVARMYRQPFRQGMVAYIIGGLLGVITSAVFLLPLSDLQDSLSVGNFFNIASEGFVLTGYQLIDVFHDPKSKTFYIALIIVLAIGVWLLMMYRKHWLLTDKQRTPEITIGAILLIALAFQIPYLMYPVNQLLPLLKLLQFSWRWNIWVTFAVAVFVASALGSKRQREFMVIASTLATIVVAVSFYRSTVNLDLPNVKIASLTRASEYLPNNINLPIEEVQTQLLKHQRDPEIQVINGYAALKSIKREPFSTSFEINSNKGNSTLVFKRMYFPTWYLRDDRGVHYAISPDSLGRINAVIPEGKRFYILSIVTTNSERIGAWLSVVGLSYILALGIIIMLSRKKVVRLS